MYKRKEIIGDCTLFLGDNKDIIDSVECDAIITDPPYGVGEDGGRYRDRKGGGHRVLPKKTWDKERPNKAMFSAILNHHVPTVIWGGNYFADLLPASKGWIYWDKLMGGDFADGELAWTNINRALRKVTKCNKIHGKTHPTEKHVEVMEFSINFIREPAQTILDPFMGSGTTLVACAKMSRKGIGIELDEGYFDIACKRVEDAYRQPDLFYNEAGK